MSAVKNYLLACEEALDSADLSLYATSGELQALADRAWAGGDVASWAPGIDWITEAQAELNRAMKALIELREARGCIDWMDQTGDRE